MEGYNRRNCVIAAIFLLILGGIQNVAATELADPPEGFIPDNPVPVPLPEEYLNSRFHQPCLRVRKMHFQIIYLLTGIF